MKKMMLAIAVCLGFALTSCQKNNDALGLLSASRSDETADRCKGRPIPNCGCPDVWAPVCGCDGQTYSNSCEATCAGVRFYTNGACCMTKPKPSCPCPDVWAPVCGCNGQTYSNSCEATCAGVLFYTPGDCDPYGGIEKK